MERTRHVLNHGEEVEPEHSWEYIGVTEDYSPNENFVILNNELKPTMYGIEGIVGSDMDITIDGNSICRHIKIFNALSGENAISPTLSDSGNCTVIIPDGYTNKIAPGGTVTGILRFRADIGSGIIISEYVFSGDFVKETSTSPGTGTYTPKRGTVVITESTILNAQDHDQMTLICKNTVDIDITIPVGLGTDFDCNIVAEEIGTRWVNFVAGTGVTLKAPHGTKLLDAYTCNIIKRTGAEIFNLQGEVTP